MMTKHRALIYLSGLAITIAMAGCDSGSETKTNGFNGLSADVSALVGALCKRLDECAGDEPLFASEIGCVDRWRALYRCNSRLGSAQIANLDACLSALDALSCETVLAEPFEPRVCLHASAALEAELGYLAAGDACGIEGADCRADTSCHLSDGSCGTCMPEQKEGDACVDECDGELFCNDAGECQTFRVEGESCNAAGQCYSRICSDGKCSTPHLGDDCIEGIFCGDYLRCVEGKCSALAKIGEACDPIDDDFPTCTYDAECVDGRCVAIARCHEGEPGSPCLTSAQCVDGSSCSDLDGTCVKDAAEGEPCSLDGVRCAADLYCRGASDFEQGTCQKPTPDEVPEPVVCE